MQFTIDLKSKYILNSLVNDVTDKGVTILMVNLDCYRNDWDDSFLLFASLFDFIMNLMKPIEYVSNNISMANLKFCRSFPACMNISLRYIDDVWQ